MVFNWYRGGGGLFDGGPWNLRRAPKMSHPERLLYQSGECHYWQLEIMAVHKSRMLVPQLRFFLAPNEFKPGKIVLHGLWTMTVDPSTTCCVILLMVETLTLVPLVK